MSQSLTPGEPFATPPLDAGNPGIPGMPGIGVSTGSGGLPGSIELEMDETYLSTYYGSISRVWGTAEEIIMDFSSGLKPKGPQSATLPLEQRVVLGPKSAKRLLISLAKVLENHERIYGPLVLEQNLPMGAVASDGAKPTGGSMPGSGSSAGEILR